MWAADILYGRQDFIPTLITDWARGFIGLDDHLRVKLVRLECAGRQEVHAKPWPAASRLTAVVSNSQVRADAGRLGAAVVTRSSVTQGHRHRNRRAATPGRQQSRVVIQRQGERERTTAVWLWWRLAMLLRLQQRTYRHMGFSASTDLARQPALSGL